MNTLSNYIAEYIEYCEYRKRLDVKTLKAYKIDLRQYENFCHCLSDCFDKTAVDTFITSLHKKYKPKTVKRKIASLKAFFHHLEYQEILNENPFTKLDIHFREAKLLPKTIPFHSIQTLLSTLYAQKEQAETEYQLHCCIRDIAVIELLFATGMRISELCSLKPCDIDLESNNILIYGKGSKERIMQLGNQEVIAALSLYQETFQKDMEVCGYFCKQTQAQIVRPVSALYDQPLCGACRHQPAHHSAYVPAFFCNPFIGAGCRYQIYPKNAWTQFDQHDGNIHTCIKHKTERYSDT